MCRNVRFLSSSHRESISVWLWLTYSHGEVAVSSQGALSCPTALLTYLAGKVCRLLFARCRIRRFGCPTKTGMHWSVRLLLVKYSSCSMLKLSSPGHVEGKDSRLFADAFRYLRLTTASARIRLRIIQTTPLTRKRNCTNASVDSSIRQEARQWCNIPTHIKICESTNDLPAIYTVDAHSIFTVNSEYWKAHG